MVDSNPQSLAGRDQSARFCLVSHCCWLFLNSKISELTGGHSIVFTIQTQGRRQPRQTVKPSLWRTSETCSRGERGLLLSAPTTVQQSREKARVTVFQFHGTLGNSPRVSCQRGAYLTQTDRLSCCGREQKMRRDPEW